MRRVWVPLLAAGVVLGALPSTAVAAPSRVSTSAVSGASDVTAATPKPVKKPAVSTVTESSVTLSWIEPAFVGLAGVMVRRAAGGSPPRSASSGTLVKDVKRPAHLLKVAGLSPGSEYSFALFAHDGHKHYARPADVTVTTAPAAVTGLSAAATASTVTLNWSSPKGAVGVVVRQATGTKPPSSPEMGTAAGVVPSPGHSLTVTGLVASTNYAFSVFAYNDAHTYSTARAVQTHTAVQAPGPVTGLQVTGSTSTSLALAWTNPTNSDFAGVMVRRLSGSTAPTSPTSGTFVVNTSGSTHTLTDANLDQGTHYSYALFAHSSAPTYASGVTITGMTSPDSTAPGPVTGLQVTGSTTSSVSLAWSNPTDADFAGVMVRRASGATPPSSPTSGTLVVDTTGSTDMLTDSTGLSAGQTYSYALFAHDAVPNYATATTVTTKTAASSDSTAPGPVTGLQVTGSTTSSVSLAWSNPTDGDFAGVMVRRASGATPPSSPTSGTLVMDTTGSTDMLTDSTGLSAGQTYSYALFAHDAVPNYATATTVTESLSTAVQHVSGTIATSTTWVSGITYVLDTPMTVASGSTLTLQAGVTVKAARGANLTINGSLVTQGTAGSPVTFTSLRDDSVGGDTNGDGSATSPANGDWSGLTVQGSGSGSYSYSYLNVDFAPLSLSGSGSVSLAHSSVGQGLAVDTTASNGSSVSLTSVTAGGGLSEYSSASSVTVQGDSVGGGLTVDNAGGTSGAVTVTGNTVSSGISVKQYATPGSTTVSQNTVSGPDEDGYLQAGIDVDTGTSAGTPAATVQNNSVTGADVAVHVNGSHLLPAQLTGNTATGNTMNVLDLTGTLSASLTLPDADLLPVVVYTLQGATGLTVASGVTLTMAAGSDLKFGDVYSGGCGFGDPCGPPSLVVDGSLVTQGTAGSPVTFTSLRDDSVGGDTNGDGSATSPANGDWSGLTVQGSGSGSYSYSYLNVDFAPLSLSGSGSVSLAHSSVGQGLAVDTTASNGSSVSLTSVTAGGGLSEYSSASSVTVQGDSVGGGLTVDNAGGTSGAVTVTGNTVSSGISVKQYATPGSTTVSQNTVSGPDEDGYLQAGIDVDTGTSAGTPAATVQNNSVTGADVAVHVNGSHLLPAQLTGNTATGNTMNVLDLTGTLSASLTLPDADLLPVVVYTLQGATGLTVASGVTLTMAAGSDLKFGDVYSGGCGFGDPCGPPSLVVDGSLVTQGTAGSPVTFTSLRDDSVGGDTNGDGSATSPANGDWSGLTVQGSGSGSYSYSYLNVDFAPLSLSGSGSVSLAHSSVGQGLAVDTTASNGSSVSLTSVTAGGGLSEYSSASSVTVQGDSVGGGLTVDNAGGTSGAVTVTGNTVSSGISVKQYATPGSTTVSQNTVSGPDEDGYLQAGIDVDTGTSAGTPAATVQNNSVTGADVAVHVNGSHLLPAQLTGNTATGNTMNVLDLTGTLSASLTLPDADLLPVVVYTLQGATGLTVASGVTLTMAAGSDLKFGDVYSGGCGFGDPCGPPSLVVDGSLVTQGTAGSPVTFTSLRDDSVGGDTNGDGSATSPANGDWSGIDVEQYGVADFSDTTVSYAPVTACGNDEPPVGVVECAPPPAAPSAQSYGSGSGVSGFDAVNPSGFFAEPVNTGSGAYSSVMTDARVTGVGVPLAFTRSYTSDDSYAGPLGPGWTDSLNTFVTTGAGGVVSLTDGSGQVSVFTPSGGGSFTAAPGVRSALTADQSGGWLLMRQDQERLVFNPAGQLVSWVDRNGVGLSLSYSGSGLLSSVTDFAGRVVSFTYNGSGLLASMSFPPSRTVTYAYNSNNQLASVTNAAGGVTSYTYDSSGYLASVTDADGHRVVDNTYDDSTGRVVSQVNSLGKTATFSWDPSSQTCTYTDPNGGQWEDVYSGTVLVERVDPTGGVTSYAYDSNLDRTAVTDPDGNTTTFSYNTAGDLLSQTAPSPINTTQSWTYDAKNDVTSFTDGRGKTTDYSYDSRGDLTGSTLPDGSTTSQTDDPATGAVTSVTDARGNTTTYAYNGSGELVSVTDPEGNTTGYGYDDAGRRTSVTDPRDKTTTTGYDGLDRVTSVTDPDGDVTSYGYDAAGNRTSVTDGDGNKTTYGYDADNDLTSVTAPDGSTTSYTYDGDGNRLSVTTGNDDKTTYGYDSDDRLVSVTSPLGKTTSCGYDPAGNRTSTTDADGVTTTDSYDALDRLTGISYSDSTPSVSYTYDGDGSRSAMTDGTGTTSYTYTDRDQLSAVSSPQGDYAYGYDPDGDVTTRTTPDGATTTYTYDTDDRVASLALDGHATTFTYTADSQPAVTTLPSGVAESRSYTAGGRVSEVKSVKGATVVSDYSYSYDSAGNPVTQTVNGQTNTLTYNSDGRLTGVCYGSGSCPDGKQSWTYDADGDRTTQTATDLPGQASTAYTYNAADELTKTIAGATTTTYGYNADGQQTTAGAAAYTYNGADELTAATSPAGTTTSHYTYTGDGLPATSTTAGSTTTFSYDMTAAVPELTDIAAMSGTTRYTWANSNPVLMSVDGADDGLSHDALGTVTAITSPAATVLGATTYDPYGNPVTTTGTITSPLGWQATYTDPVTGLDQDLARDLSPTNGQFLTPDPLPTPNTLPAPSPYLYADNQPTTHTDPTGQQSQQQEEQEGINDACGLGADVCAVTKSYTTGLSGAQQAAGDRSGAIDDASGASDDLSEAVDEATGSNIGGYASGGLSLYSAAKTLIGLDRTANQAEGFYNTGYASK